MGSKKPTFSQRLKTTTLLNKNLNKQSHVIQCNAASYFLSNLKDVEKKQLALLPT